MSAAIPDNALGGIAARVRRRVEILADAHPSRSGLFPERLAHAADFVEDEFRHLGFDVSAQPFDVRGSAFRNVCVEIPGDRERSAIVLGAHYDTVAGTPGADDNASGVAGLLELASLLRNVSLRHPLQFVAYANEEPPYFHSEHMGSRVHAKSLKGSGVQVLLMIALEMLGYASDDLRQVYPFPGMRLLGSYPEKANFISVVGNLRTRKLTRIVREAMQNGADISVASLSAPGFVPPLFLSDHSSYWREGFPAVMITDTAFLRNPHYHLPSDTAETLNYTFLAEAVRGIFAAVCALDTLLP